MSMTVLLAAAAALSMSPEAPWSEAELDQAYATCTAFLTQHMEPSGDVPIAFHERSQAQTLNAAELIFSFPFGAITGADMTEPHPITFVDKPVGSCLAYVGRDAFHRVILNGAIISDEPLAFAAD